MLGHCLRDASAKFFSFDALQLFCFTLKQISNAWVLVSFCFREGSETEEPQDVDEQATKESKLRTMWTDGAVGNSLGELRWGERDPSAGLEDQPNRTLGSQHG